MIAGPTVPHRLDFAQETRIICTKRSGVLEATRGAVDNAAAAGAFPHGHHSSRSMT